jgi:predicted XRE-type DNA-binding protein
MKLFCLIWQRQLVDDDMKNSPQRQARPPLHIQVQIMMLQKGIERKEIIESLGISKSLLSKALKGKRKTALERVAQFVRSRAAGTPKGKGEIDAEIERK